MSYICRKRKIENRIKEKQLKRTKCNTCTKTIGSKEGGKGEAILISTHNIGFYEEISKSIP